VAQYSQGLKPCGRKALQAKIAHDMRQGQCNWLRKWVPFISNEVLVRKPFYESRQIVIHTIYKQHHLYKMAATTSKHAINENGPTNQCGPVSNITSSTFFGFVR